MLEFLKEKLRVNAVRRMFRMLSVKWSETATLVTFAVLYALFEGIGIGLLMPVLQYIQTPSVAALQTTTIGAYTVRVAQTLGLPVNLGVLLVLTFIPIVLRQVVFFANTWYSNVVRKRAVIRLREQGFRDLMHADMSLFSREGTGRLLSYLTGQINTSGLAILAFIRVIAIVILVIVYVVLLMALAPALTLIAVAAMVIITVVMRSNIRRTREFGGTVTTLNNQQYRAIAERITGVRTIKMLGQEDAESDHVGVMIEDLEEATLKIGVLGGIMEVVIDPALMLSVFAVIYFGVEYLGLTLSALALFLFILLRLNAKAKEFNLGRQTFSSTLDALLFVHEMAAKARSSRTIRGGDRGFPGLRRELAFTDVEYSYPDAQDEGPVLREVTFRVPAGELVAIVGRSGAGKSTLVDLIPHLKETTAGSISFDGVPIEELELRGLRRRIGYMTQDAQLFDDTAYGNLTYGLEREPTAEELAAALDASYAAEFVRELPDGLDTVVGERGVRLSGGQRQRLALARVMLQDPDILILDEPTSALDSESERFIQKALEAQHGSKTIIVVAHRLSTVQKADQILVLAGGEIVERGTHAELLERGGTYRSLFELQLISGAV